MLHAITATLDDIPEALRPSYEEIPDPADKTKTVWALSLDDSVPKHPKVVVLQTTVDKLRKEFKTAQLALAAATEKLAKYPADFDPDNYAALIEDNNGKGRKLDDRIAAIRAEEVRKLNEAVTPLQTRVQQLEGAIRRKAANEALHDALTANAIAPEFLGAAAALIQTKYKLKLEETEPGTFSVGIDTDTGEVDVKDFVKAWTTGDEGKHFVAKARGGGADGGSGARGGGDNPWAGKSINLTKQQQMIRSNPIEARRLAMAAGQKVTW